MAKWWSVSNDLTVPSPLTTKSTMKEWVKTNRSRLLFVPVVIFVVLALVLTRPRASFHVIPRPPPTAPSQNNNTLEICTNSVPLYQWVPYPNDVWIPTAGRLDSPPQLKPPTPLRDQWKPKYCVIARTYAAQSPSETLFSVDRFLASIIMQRYSNWYLILLDTSPKDPYDYLHKDLASWAAIHEPFRIRVVNSSIFPDPVFARDLGHFENIHRLVYYKTDLAIQQLCPAESEYLISTNADNWYHPSFFEKIDVRIQENPVDLIGVDFFTRHAFWVWKVLDSLSCKLLQRFSPVICNSLLPGRTDLGSVAFKLSRWRSDNITFHDILPCDNPSGADGCVIHDIRSRLGWSVHRIPQALFSHAPNPWLCILFGGQVLHVILPQSNNYFECVSSYENALLVSQEYLTEVNLPFGTCYHPDRFSTAPQEHLFSVLS